MKIRMQNGLPYVQASLIHQNQQKTFNNILVDTLVFQYNYKRILVVLSFRPDRF